MGLLGVYANNYGDSHRKKNGVELYLCHRKTINDVHVIGESNFLHDKIQYHYIFLATASNDCRIIYWAYCANLQTISPIKIESIHTGGVLSISINHLGNGLIFWLLMHIYSTNPPTNLLAAPTNN